MQSRWSDADAAEMVARYADWGEDVALRVYTSRLIGSDPCLVMHGGGNTSVKSRWRNLLGEDVPALFVKGSGWSLDALEPPGLPALDLGYLLRLRDVETLTDEEMVNELRTHLFDASAPNPSVETLLHAFLPHKFIDHSHADVILALSNQENGEELLREALGNDVGFVPYVMPGFGLARAAAAAAEGHDGKGLVLLQHGLFTWGETARESYERHIELVSRAEGVLEARTGRRLRPQRPADDAGRRREVAARVAPVLRGALSARHPRRRPWILDFRCSAAIAELVDDPAASELLETGPLTPDHVIRTKARPLVLPAWSEDGAEESWRAAVESALALYAERYDETFRACVEVRDRRGLQKLDALPRLVFVNDLGAFAIGETRRAALVAGDILVHTAEVKAATRGLGSYRALPSEDLFDVEYWSLEQAKLGKGPRAALEGRVALVTGAGGAIGAAIVEGLARDGAAVVATDVDAAALARTVERVTMGGGACVAVTADVTDEHEVAGLFRTACRELGGVDIVVLNAGIAHSAPLGELALGDWERVVRVNLTGYFLTLREAARLFERQGSGGNVVVNASKNVFAPGAEFAAYSVSKAGGHQLGRLAAIELAPLGVRVNMVNPDAVFAHGDVPSGLWRSVGPDRARARGLEPEELEGYYRQRNLLKAPVTAEDVARAVLFFARAETPTTGATLPVDGGLPEAFPR